MHLYKNNGYYSAVSGDPDDFKLLQFLCLIQLRVRDHYWCFIITLRAGDGASNFLFATLPRSDLDVQRSRLEDRHFIAHKADRLCLPLPGFSQARTQSISYPPALLSQSRGFFVFTQNDHERKNEIPRTRTRQPKRKRKKVLQLWLYERRRDRVAEEMPKQSKRGCFS